MRPLRRLRSPGDTERSRSAVPGRSGRTIGARSRGGHAPSRQWMSRLPGVYGHPSHPGDPRDGRTSGCQRQPERQPHVFAYLDWSQADRSTGRSGRRRPVERHRRLLVRGATVPHHRRGRESSRPPSATPSRDLVVHVPPGPTDACELGVGGRRPVTPVPGRPAGDARSSCAAVVAHAVGPTGPCRDRGRRARPVRGPGRGQCCGRGGG